MPIEIRRVAVPERLGTPGAGDFESYAALGFELERANWGHDHFAETAAELFGRHRNDVHRGHAVYGAWDDGTMVGRCGLDWERDERATTVEFTLGVLPSQRRRGVGSRLLAAAEEAARDLGRSTMVAYSDHPDDVDQARGADRMGATSRGAVLRAPDGDAELSAATPTAAFATAHGYVLAQLERVSSIALERPTPLREQPHRVVPERVDLHGLAATGRHDPITHLRVHPCEREVRRALRQQTITVHADTEARTSEVKPDDLLE